MKILTTIFLLFLTLDHANADDANADNISAAKDLKEYDVEIIIFEDAHARYLKSETWDQKATTEEQQSATTKKNKISTTGFKSIKPAILKKQYKRINGSSEYNVLFYGAWRQAGLDKNKAFEININKLKSSHTDKSENNLSGTFKLVLARYLHIYNQLNYHRKITETTDPETTAANPDEGEEQTEVVSNGLVPNNGIYPLNSHRRMRSKELHYIDHPLVGMLIQINPVKKKKETKE
ncbi:MAG: hypothetical protein DRQ35_03350 [Gammaproteobacteria bacterium]|nr:MAG: hypothetical protein DRQ35_03350 [Gammaproteobacteria bacterium]